MSKRIRNNNFHIAIASLFVAFNFYLVYWLIVIPEQPNMWIAYSFLLIWGIISSLQLRVALIRRDYLKLSKKMVVYPSGKRSITVIAGSKETLVTVKNLKYVDIFYSWNTSSFSSDLQYASLELTDGLKLLIPEHSIEIYKLKRMFRKKVRTVRNRFMNSLR